MMSIARLVATLILVACSATVHATLITYQSTLVPETLGATGSGSVQLVFDTSTNELTINANWSGLSGTTTVAHVHCCTATPYTGTAGVAVAPNTLPAFPIGVTSGIYALTIDLADPTSFGSTFLTLNSGTAEGARGALLNGLDSGRSYFNIHTVAFPAGEIRGFLQRDPDSVPEPATLALLGLSLAGIAFTRICKSSRARRG